MSLSKSDNAIMAKVHSLYGKRLSEEDYSALLQKRSVGEIAGYLKSAACYSKVLSEVKEELVRREQLEHLIKRNTLDTYLSLMKYSYNDQFFLKMYIIQNEVEQLLLAMRLLNAGDMKSLVVSLPLYLSKHMSFDLFEIARAKDYDDLLEAVKKSGFYQILGRHRPVSSGRPVDIPACETDLLTYYYSEVLNLINASFSGKARENLRLLINDQIDLYNIMVIYRMKRYFSGDPGKAAERLIRIRAGISKKVYGEMLGAESYMALGEIVNGLKLTRQFRVEPDSPAESLFFQAQRIKKRASKRVFRFSIEPVVVVFCYMTLLEIEANNIINIIEGTRYGLSPDEIRGMLVI